MGRRQCAAPTAWRYGPTTSAKIAQQCIQQAGTDKPCRLSPCPSRRIASGRARSAEKNPCAACANMATCRKALARSLYACRRTIHQHAEVELLALAKQHAKGSGGAFTLRKIPATTARWNGQQQHSFCRELTPSSLYQQITFRYTICRKRPDTRDRGPTVAAGQSATSAGTAAADQREKAERR